MITKIFRVPDMHCSACVMILEGLEDSLPGIQSVSASYRTQQMQVTYDEAHLNQAKIISVVGELGYTIIAV